MISHYNYIFDVKTTCIFTAVPLVETDDVVVMSTADLSNPENPNRRHPRRQRSDESRVCLLNAKSVVHNENLITEDRPAW